MTETQKDAYKLVKRQYFIESVSMLAKGIPEKQRVLHSTEQASEHGQDDFFDKAASTDQPDFS